MPKKNKDKYPHYEEIKQCYALLSMTTNFGGLGHLFNDDWQDWKDEC